MNLFEELGLGFIVNRILKQIGGMTVSNWITTVLGILGGGFLAAAQYTSAHPTWQGYVGAGLVAAIGIAAKDFNYKLSASELQAIAKLVQGALSKAPLILLALCLGLAAHAQSATTTSTSTTSGLSAWGGPVAVYFQGSWQAGADSGEAWDAYDWGTPPSGSTTKPYHFLFEGHQFNVPSSFNAYTGGVGFQANLANLFQKLNAPPGNFGLFGSVTAGNGLSTTSSSSNFTTLADFGLRYQATGAVTWNVVKGGYVRYGSNNIPYISTNIQYLF